VPVLVAVRLPEELARRIEAVDSRIELLYEPALLGRAEVLYGIPGDPDAGVPGDSPEGLAAEGPSNFRPAPELIDELSITPALSGVIAT
jgi:hypothetical protein